MTLRSADLAALFTPPAGRGVGFRQGVIVTWNPATAENTVLIGDALITNLPILNTSEAAILAAGDVVGVLTAGATWGILGRFTIPASPEAVSALSSLRTQADAVVGSDTITATAFTAAPTNPGPEVQIVVGPTGRLLINMSADMSVSSSANPNPAAGGFIDFAMAGANTRVPDGVRGMRLVVQSGTTSGGNETVSSALNVGKAVILEGLNPGLTTITMQYMRYVVAGTVFTVSSRDLSVIAF